MVSSDGVMVENYYWLQYSILLVQSKKYRCIESTYVILFQVYLGFKNLYIHWNPLRDEDVDAYASFKNKQYTIGT